MIRRILLSHPEFKEYLRDRLAMESDRRKTAFTQVALYTGLNTFVLTALLGAHKFLDLAWWPPKPVWVAGPFLISLLAVALSYAFIVAALWRRAWDYPELPTEVLSDGEKLIEAGHTLEEARILALEGKALDYVDACTTNFMANNARSARLVVSLRAVAAAFGALLIGCMSYLILS